MTDPTLEARLLAVLRQKKIDTIKAYIARREFKTQDAYEMHLWAYMRDFFTGQVDAFGFIDEMANEIENQFTRAWHEGAASVGVEQADMGEEDDTELAGKITDEQNRLDGIAGDIETFISEGKHTDAEFNAKFRSRASTWANGYARTVSDAQIWFGGKQKLIWKEDGTKDKCSVCVGLDGIVAYASEWDSAGIKPQSSELPCSGFNCLCSLEPTDKRRTARALDRIMDVLTAAHV